MTWGSRGEQPDLPAAEPAQLAVPAAVRDAAVGGGSEGLNRLVDVMLRTETVASEDAARTALGFLAAQPRLVTRLDQHCRRTPWHLTYRSPDLARAVGRLDSGAAGPIALALASMHADGRIRERAVAAMLAASGPELAPFLVLRTTDWAAPVRHRARAGLALLLDDDPAGYLPAVLPMALRLDVRWRGRFARAQAVAALITAPAALRRGLATGGDPIQRRWMFDVGLAQGWLALDDLIAVALADPDARIRALAAKAACRDAVWTRRAAVARRLAASRRPEVRAVGLTGLARLGQDAEVAAHLDDDSALVRAIAREAARRLGRNPAEHYRTALAGATPPAGAVAGLAEDGAAPDAALLRGLLTHPDRRLRLAAVRGLRGLNTSAVADLVPLLNDESPSIVREATAALRPFADSLPDGLAWNLLADARVDRRRAGYRLLGGRDTHSQLRAGLTLTTDPNSRLARQARADVTRLARDAVRATWRGGTRPELRLTPAEYADLTGLADRASGSLGDDAELLTQWLRDIRPMA